MIFEVSGVHMGRYGLILCANESYTNNLAIGINVDPIPAYKQIKHTKHIKNIPKHIKIYYLNCGINNSIKCNDTFLAIDRKIINNNIIRLKLNTGGWVTEYVSYGHITKYCLPTGYKYPEMIE